MQSGRVGNRYGGAQGAIWAGGDGGGLLPGAGPGGAVGWVTRFGDFPGRSLLYHHGTGKAEGWAVRVCASVRNRDTSLAVVQNPSHPGRPPQNSPRGSRCMKGAAAGPVGTLECQDLPLKTSSPSFILNCKTRMKNSSVIALSQYDLVDSLSFCVKMKSF